MDVIAGLQPRSAGFRHDTVIPLGVTDVYASPFLKASPGSLHGYDIGSHAELNQEIGTETDFTAWSDTLL